MGKLGVGACALLVVACSHSTAAPAALRPGRTPVVRPSPAAGAPPAPQGPVAAAPPGPLDADPLAGRLDAVLFNTDSCLVVADGATGRVRYTRNADVPRAAGSAQKLLVAAAALDRLGPGYRFTTTVEAARPPVNGAVDDLWLVGGGDPLLATPAYAASLATDPVTAGYPTTPVALLADRLVAAGLRRVNHAVHGDDSRYDPSRYLATWPQQTNQGEFDVGPLSALEIDQGLQSWHPARLTADPTSRAAGILAFLLNGRAVAANGGASGPAPPGAVVLASVTSAPLADIVAAMLRVSDNQVAELLVRELDHHAGGQGTTAGGIGQVTAAAAELGLSTTGLSLVDGSGLSHANRVTCTTLLGALDLGDQPRLSTLATGLAVAGVSGTLRDLFQATPLAGHLAAKGGYIDGAQALVGRLDGAGQSGGGPAGLADLPDLPNLRFAFVINGSFPFAVGIGYVIRVVDALAGQPS